MGFGEIIETAFRSLLWMFCQAAFSLMDMCYDIIKSISTLNLGNFEFVWTWWSGICIIIGFCIIGRVFSMYIKTYIDEDALDKFSPINIMIRIGAVAIIIAFLPMILTTVSNITSSMINGMGTMFTGNENINKPSEIIVASGYSGDISTFNYNTININEKADGSYVYFSSSFDLIFALVMSVIACFVFVLIGVQIGQRLVGLMLKILISPWAVSGVVNPNDNTFGIWLKLCLADFLSSYFQIVLVLLALTASVLVPLQMHAKVVFFIGSLMAVMNAPAGIAQLLGGDVGTGTALQQMQSAMMIGNGMQMAGNAVLTAGAGAVYAGGRFSGGIGMINSGRSSGGGISSIGQGAGNLGSSAGMNNSYAGSSESSFGSGGSSSSESNQSFAKPNSFASKVGASFEKNPVGRVSNVGMKSLYQKSSARLARDVQYRTYRGGLAQRNSKITTASNTAHKAVDAFKNKGGSNNAV